MPALNKDWRILLYLFLAMRVVLLMVYLPEIGRGLSWLGDYQQHYELARTDHLPYQDYWVEFPPVWIFMGKIIPAQTFTAWASILFLMMTAFDAGNLWLMRNIGTRLYGEDTGFSLAWIYALLPASIIMAAWNFEVMVSFTMLAGFWLFLQKKYFSSGMMIAFGILTKYVPLLLLPVIWRFASRKEAILATVLSIGITAMVLIPLILWGGEMAIKSLTVQFNKPSYQTIWALIDGNYGTGSFPNNRYDANADTDAGRNSALIPAWIRIIPFAAVGLWVYFQPMPNTDQVKLAFFSITVFLFMLWSQGWSPQWMVILLPLILLNFPSRLGVLIALVLMIGAFIEYPLLFRYTADTGNVISGQNRIPFAMLIVTRTLIFGGITGVLIGRVRA